ncbi:hypothetical protein [Shewanella litorisediminis]|uniref:DUF4178 domain-containing protein n=1 Tax=Shewanella litorisediminis TaxID=1173586 RepID=A0ABX7G221_9GAMM|nr:hypothetical protein [Shewanella litorisediminis]MCL2918486.1 hypothetical protein [Shewanella litorisediminis]QRH01318.1 hypothetical protein JQC75_15910 [Shewanella litorisediminis]
MGHPRGVALAVERLGDNVRLLFLHYQDRGLKVSLNIEGQCCELTFEKLLGFRVLDEGDLLEYWAELSLSNGWLYEVSEGGWLEQESLRSGFMASSHHSPREFLVVTEKECISVLTLAMQPQVRWCDCQQVVQYTPLPGDASAH